MTDLQPGALDLVISPMPRGPLVWVFGTPGNQTCCVSFVAALSLAHDTARTRQVNVWVIDDDRAWLVKSYRPTEEWQVCPEAGFADTYGPVVPL